MKAMLSVLAIVVMIVKTTTSDILEYDEQEVRKFNDKMNLKWTKKADIINGHVTMDFQRVYDPRANGFVLKSVTLPDPSIARNDDICRKFLGIRVHGVEEYLCNITQIDVKNELYTYDWDQTPQEENEPLVITLHFNIEGRLAADLDIPVLIVPKGSVLDTRDDRLVNIVERSYRIGLSSPFHPTMLADIAVDARITLEFEWLSKLLKHDISGSEFIRRVPGTNGVTDVLVYVARPLVLPKEIVEIILRVFV